MTTVGRIEFLDDYPYSQTPVYCEACGDKLVTEQRTTDRFDPYTGKPATYQVVRCPKATETDRSISLFGLARSGQPVECGLAERFPDFARAYSR